MTIKISRNLEEIKGGGLRIFTPRQLGYGVVTLLIVMTVYLVLDRLLTGVGLDNQYISLISGFCGIAVAYPIGYRGFFRRAGLTYQEYQRAKKTLNAPLRYMSTENPEVDIAQPEREAEKGGPLSERIVLLLMRHSRKKKVVQSGQDMAETVQSGQARKGEEGNV